MDKRICLIHFFWKIPGLALALEEFKHSWFEIPNVFPKICFSQKWFFILNLDFGYYVYQFLLRKFFQHWFLEQILVSVVQFSQSFQMDILVEYRQTDINAFCNSHLDVQIVEEPILSEGNFFKEM